MLNAIRERGTIDELKRIAKRNKGILVAEDVVEEARPCDNPLHKYFEWDDTEAARKWRLVQARNLINVCVEIIPNTNDKESRIFVSLTTDRNNDEGGGYRAIVNVLSDTEHRAQLLQDAVRELQAVRDKYRNLTELASVFEQIDLAHKRIAKR